MLIWECACEADKNHFCVDMDRDLNITSLNNMAGSFTIFL